MTLKFGFATSAAFLAAAMMADSRRVLHLNISSLRRRMHFDNFEYANTVT